MLVWPTDNVIFFAQSFSTSEVRLASGLVQPTDDINTTLPEQHHSCPIRHQTVGQKDIAAVKDISQSAEQADFTLSLAGVATDPQIEDRSAGKRHDRRDPGDRKAYAGLLVVELRISSLVRFRIRHAHCSPIEHQYAASFLQPRRICLRIPTFVRLSKLPRKRTFPATVFWLGSKAPVAAEHALSPREMRCATKRRHRRTT